MIVILKTSDEDVRRTSTLGVFSTFTSGVALRVGNSFGVANQIFNNRSSDSKFDPSTTSRTSRAVSAVTGTTPSSNAWNNRIFATAYSSLLVSDRPFAAE